MRNPVKRAGTRLQLRMIPLIDVMFLLLIFFMLTTNFRSREGFLPAVLPQPVRSGPATPREPLNVLLESGGDGGCLVRVGTAAIALPARNGRADFAPLRERLGAILTQDGRHTQDPIKLIPAARTKWDHVVRTYDALWQAGMENIIFAIVPD